MDNDSSNRWTGRADEIVAMARRHAAEIRVSAEQEADRVIQEAERRAASVAEAHLEANRQELDRLAALRLEIGQCLSTAVSALERARLLSEGRTDSASASVPKDSAVPLVSPTGSSTEISAQESTSRYPRLSKIAAAVWGMFMVVIVLLVTLPPSETPSAAVAPDVNTAPVDVQQTVSVDRETAQVTPAAQTTRAPEPSDLSVTVIANEECWISTASDEDAPRERLLRAGERIVVRADDAVTLRAGNAGALSVLINDRPAAPLGRERQVVTRRITRANYASLLAPQEQAANIPSAQ